MRQKFQYIQCFKNVRHKCVEAILPNGTQSILVTKRIPEISDDWK